MKFNSKDFDRDRALKEGIKSLCKRMVETGMAPKPLPKVKFIDNDEENANNLLGRTAYYEPETTTIALFTMNRHPKDILRSFAHEMIHHKQNIENRLKNIHTVDINEDSHLFNLELEAYRDGNLALREWEDTIKNKR
jgi:hypothetical protein